MPRPLLAMAICLSFATYAFTAPITAVSVSGTGVFNNSPSLLIDGVTPPKTTFFADPMNVWWEGTIPVFTIDLGAQYLLEDVRTSLDNNDNYAFQYSLDGISYFPLFTVLVGHGTVVPVPGGMDTFSTNSADVADYVAALDFSPVVARYLQVRATGGNDTLFAAGEVSAFGTAVPEPQFPQGLHPGDVFGMNQGGGTGAAGVLIHLDTSSGVRTAVSDLGDAGQGQTGSNSASSRRSVAVDASGGLFVADGGFQPADGSQSGFVFRVDPSTGARTVITDFSDPGQGPRGSGVTPSHVAIDQRGDLLVMTAFLLFRIDPSTGTRTVVSDFLDSSQGPPTDLIRNPIAIDHSGNIFVVSVITIPGVPGGAPRDRLLRVDPLTGARVIVSDFSNPTQGPVGLLPALAVDHSGELLAAVVSSTISALVRVDPNTGVRTVVSDLLGPQGGPAIGAVTDLDIEDSDTVLMAGASPSVVFRVDLTTGVRTILSDPADPTQGVGLTVSNLAVVPTPIVNELISQSSLSTSFDPTPQPNAPAGTFTITAMFTNTSPTAISSPFVRVTELSGGNVLLNAEGRHGGVGARITADVGIDGTLFSGESLTMDFVVGLQSREPFRLFVNILGVPVQ